MTMPIKKFHPLFKIANGALVDLPAPTNISTLWNFGSLLGIFLAMHYTAHVDLAFSSVAYICRAVNYG